METPDFFRSRIDAMINLRHPLAVLATRLPWGVIEAALAPKFERKDRPGQLIEGQDMLGPTAALVGAGRSNAGQCEFGELHDILLQFSVVPSGVRAELRRRALGRMRRGR